MPPIKPPPLPPGPPADLSGAGLAGFRTQSAAPNFLRFSPGMTPLQQRSQISTFGTQGMGPYADEATKKYYRDIAFNSLLDPSGKVLGEPLPSEWAYAENVLGVKPRQRTTESFLSAIRGIG